MSDNTLQRWQRGVADIFIEGLKDGSSPWLKPWDAGEIPPMSYNPVSGVTYRGGNQMALMFAEHGQGYSDKRWMTYKQAEAIGAQVRKGEKALMLMTYKEVDVPVREGEPPRPEGALAPKRLLAIPFFVFNGEQIDGLPPAQVFQHRPLDERLKEAQRIVDATGVPVIYGGNQAFYNPNKDEIHMPAREAFASDALWMSTLLHESGHSTGHESRLNRWFAQDRSKAEYAREELIAELSSFEASRRLGVPFDPSQHIAYVNSWIEHLQRDPSEITRAASGAEKVMTYLGVPELVIEKIPVLEKVEERIKEQKAVKAEQEQVVAKKPAKQKIAKVRKSKTKAKEAEAEIAF